MQFYDRLLKRVERLPEAQKPRMREWIANGPSSCPATEKQLSWLPRGPHSALEAEGILILCTLHSRYWETWEIIDRIRKQCYFQQYQGEWEKVQRILEQLTDFASLEENYTNFWSEDDFFGNLIPLCARILRENPHAFKNTERDRRKPRKKVYRRGHDDKGSLRPTHERGRDIGESGTPEDRRHLVRLGHLPDI